MERLQTIWEEGGRPSALMLRTLARRQNVDITVRESQEFVAAQAGRQGQQATIERESPGEPTRGALDDRFDRQFEETKATIGTSLYTRAC